LYIQTILFIFEWKDVRLTKTILRKNGVTDITLPDVKPSSTVTRQSDTRGGADIQMNRQNIDIKCRSIQRSKSNLMKTF
jgi:hypothetical protein